MLRSITKEFIQWQRAFLQSIPGRAGEQLRNRYYGYNHGSAVRVPRAVTIYHPEKLFIGTDTGISSGTQINAAGTIRIGKSVLIGPNCVIWSQNHKYKMPNIEIRLQGYENSPVIIEDDVWIAASCVILPGVTIEKGAVIAAGAVVTKSCQAGAVVAGVPGRMIGNRNE